MKALLIVGVLALALFFFGCLGSNQPVQPPTQAPSGNVNTTNPMVPPGNFTSNVTSGNLTAQDDVTYDVSNDSVAINTTVPPELNDPGAPPQIG